MKKIVVILITLSMITVVLFAQTTKIEWPKANFSDSTKYRDSIPVLPDSVAFVNNTDLVNVDYIIKKVMTSNEWKVAGDPISQYQLLISNLNQQIFTARQRWEQQNKIRVPIKK